MNVFITGGSRGIGRGIVLKFVQEGHGCGFTYVGNTEAANETIRMAKEINPDVPVFAYKMDLRVPQQIEDTVDQAITDLGDISALINNAAMVKDNAAVMMSNEEWDDVIAANLSGPFYTIRSFLMHFISNRYGRILNISSLAHDGSSGQVNYASSKAGLNGLTKTIAKEYGAKGITCNVLSLGYVPTEMTKNHMIEALEKFWMTYCPLKRGSSVEEIANIIYFLCSKESEFINGEVIKATGGLNYTV